MVQNIPIQHQSLQVYISQDVVKVMFKTLLNKN